MSFRGNEKIARQKHAPDVDQAALESHLAELMPLGEKERQSRQGSNDEGKNDV